MRLFAVIFCLVLSLNAFAQSRDTSRKLIADTAVKSKPLLVIDGIISDDGDLKNINPNDILAVNVLKNPGATNIYGPRGTNGVIIIQTKHYSVPTHTSKSLDSFVSKDALYVIDGVPSKNKLIGIDPKDVLSINILKKGKNTDPSFEPVNDVVVVVTKTEAIKAYQKKFSTFSAKYKDGLEKHNGDDNNLVYILNGSPVQGKRDYIIGTLYNISPEKIKNVSFNQREMDKDHGSATVIINLEDIIINLR
jgi:TonB-dependent SusC/RagA subfamily outer membrane receptor